MYYKDQEGIVTDQCQAMKNASATVFPQTRHRWCLWHIMKKIPEKLQGYNQYKDIKRIMKEVVYESESMDKFETNWSNFIAHFSLVDNQWLTSLYEK